MSTENTPKSTSDAARPAPAARPPYQSRYQGGRPSSPGGAPTGAPGMGMRRGMKPPFKKRSCRVCEEKKGFVDWKMVNYLRTFVTDRGKMLAGRSKGTCAPCQRALARAIKRARTMALLPTSPL